MPIIYRATKDVLRSVNYGIALGTGDKGFTDMVSDFFGNAVTDAIGEGVDQLNSSQEVYWSPYVEIPNLGNVYSLPSIVTSGTTMYSFYQGQAPYTSEGGTGGFLYYSARSCGAVLSDKPFGILYPDPDAPSGAASPAPPVGVMFGGKVYAFYGTNTAGPTGQVYCTAYDGATWSAPQPVPGVSSVLYDWTGATPAVTPVVFTPPGSLTPQLFLFYIIQTAAGDATLSVACVATADGETWTAIAPDGISTVSSLDQPYVSAAVYASTGGSEQIYLFFNSASNFTYVTYPDTNGGFSAPTTITSDVLDDAIYGATVAAINGAVVYTPPGATDALLYVFVSQTSTATGKYSDYVAEDDLGTYNATEDTTFSYPLHTILFTTFDGTTWSACQPVPNASFSWGATSQVPSVAVLPSASFDGNLSPIADIYLSTVQSAQPYSQVQLPGGDVFAAFVGGLSAYSAGEAPSQATAFPAYSTNPWDHTPFTGVGSASLLAAELTGSAAPQPWLFHGDWDQSSNVFQMQYAVYSGGIWTSYPLPAIEVPALVTPQTIGSPAILPVLTGSPYQPSQNLIVFNTTSGMQGSASGIAPACGEDIGVGPISTVSGATGSPSLAWLNNQASVFYQGAGSQAGQLWYSQWDTTQSWNWDAAVQVPDVTLSESPSAVVFDGNLYVFFQGGSNNGQLWYVCQSGTSDTWSAPVQVIPTGEDASSVLLSGSPSACVYTDASGGGQLFVAYAGTGTTGNWQLTYLTLGTDGIWTQAIVPGVLIAESPSAYQVTPAAYTGGNGGSGSNAGRLNVFFQPASSPGELFYCVYNGAKWSPVATTPVTTLEGWVSGIMYQGSDEALLSLVHNNSGTAAGQISCCQCTLASTAGGATSGPLLGGPFEVDEDGTTEYFPAMAGAPAAAIANGDIYVFYNSTYLSSSSSTYVAGALAYIQIPLPANGEQISLPGGISGPVGANADALFYGTGFIAMANSPAAATFQGLPFVFYNTGNGSIGYFTDPTAKDPQILESSSVASDCSPAAVVCNNVLYVFWTASGSNGEGALQCNYTFDGKTWGDIDLNPGLTVNTEGVIASVCDGLIYLVYSQNGVTYYDIFPQVAVETAQTVSVGLAPATPISRMACSTGPSVAAFNNGLWCVTQGVNQSNYSPLKGWSIEPSGDLFFSRTLDATNWSWNTAINHAAVASAPPSSTTLPIVTTFAPTGGSELVYVFWPDTSGYIQYATTDGSYVTPSSSEYGLPWSTPQGIGSAAYTNDNLGVVAMPPLDSPGDPEQLYVFWQGSKHSGVMYYATMNPSGAWSGTTQIDPVGCTPGDKFMTFSPSAVSYAPIGEEPQPFVFYQKAGSSGEIGDCIDLEYCSYAGGTWTQYEVPNITSTIYSEWGGVTYAQPQTVSGIDAGTPPRAITFNGLLYVFYVTKSGGYTSDTSGKPTPYTVFPVSYSTYDGAAWSSLHTIGSTATYQKEENDAAANYIAQYVYPAVLNGVLYVFYMSAATDMKAIDPPGAIYYTCTSDGTHWSSAQPTTNVIYVPGGTTTIDDNLGTEINDTLAAVNGALSYIGLPTTYEVRNNIAAGVIGVFF